MLRFAIVAEEDGLLESYTLSEATTKEVAVEELKARFEESLDVVAVVIANLRSEQMRVYETLKHLDDILETGGTFSDLVEALVLEGFMAGKR
ncbi:hypothetical protein KKD84_04645 [Patescibacteria group bacterium]|nr:hypothetical protein [Patescibacteria group bacterium]